MTTQIELFDIGMGSCWGFVGVKGTLIPTKPQLDMRQMRRPPVKGYILILLFHPGFFTFLHFIKGNLISSFLFFRN
jgi:hypothetical protein